MRYIVQVLNLLICLTYWLLSMVLQGPSVAHLQALLNLESASEGPSACLRV
jgi:hypothetical protein